MTFDQLDSVQNFLTKINVNGWLITDFQNTNPPGTEFLEIPEDLHTSRRWLYWIPAQGKPTAITHAIESNVLKHLPGNQISYASRQNLHLTLKNLLANAETVAMEYSPMGRIPTASRVDAGTIEFVRSAGVQIVSSADLLQHVTSRWGDWGLKSHLQAAKMLRNTADSIWDMIANSLSGKPVNEYQVQQFILKQFKDQGFQTDHPPICAVNENAADPHFDVQAETAQTIKPDQLVLVDMWARRPDPGSIYADVTWMAYTGEKIPDEIQTVFNVVKEARDATVDAVTEAFCKGNPITGADLDRVCRGIIQKAGYGSQFLHRTGHSLGKTVHGSGANLDSIETEDERIIIPDTGFTIEPGIYLKNRFGVRLELDVVILPDNTVQITGQPIQTDLICIS